MVLVKGQIHKQKRIKNLDIHSHKYGHLIFDEVAKKDLGEGEMVLKHLVIQMQSKNERKEKFEPKHLAYAKSYLKKWITDINVKHKTIKYLGGNIGKIWS